MGVVGASSVIGMRPIFGRRGRSAVATEPTLPGERLRVPRNVPSVETRARRGAVEEHRATAVPEPTTLAFFGVAGALGLAGYVRRRRDA